MVQYGIGWCRKVECVCHCKCRKNNNTKHNHRSRQHTAWAKHLPGTEGCPLYILSFYCLVNRNSHSGIWESPIYWVVQLWFLYIYIYTHYIYIYNPLQSLVYIGSNRGFEHGWCSSRGLKLWSSSIFAGPGPGHRTLWLQRWPSYWP